MPAPDTEGRPGVILVDVFGGMSASRVALIASSWKRWHITTSKFMIQRSV